MWSRLDWRVAPGWTVGAAIGVSSGSADFDLAGGKADYRSVLGAFHASYEADGFAASAYVDYARRRISRRRAPGRRRRIGHARRNRRRHDRLRPFGALCGAAGHGPASVRSAGCAIRTDGSTGYTPKAVCRFLAQSVDPQKDLTAVRGDGGGFVQTDVTLGSVVLRGTLVATLEHDFQDTSRLLTSRIVSQSTIPMNTLLGSYDDTWGRVGATVELVQAGPFLASFGGSTTVGKKRRPRLGDRRPAGFPLLTLERRALRLLAGVQRSLYISAMVRRTHANSAWRDRLDRPAGLSPAFFFRWRCFCSLPWKRARA